MNKNTRPVDSVSTAVAKVACDWVQEEQNALYALADAALKRLEPPEGTDPAESDNFFAYMLVKLMNERLESTEFLTNLRDLLNVQPANTEPVPASVSGANRRAAS